MFFLSPPLSFAGAKIGMIVVDEAFHSLISGEEVSFLGFLKRRPD